MWDQGLLWCGSVSTMAKTKGIDIPERIALSALQQFEAIAHRRYTFSCVICGDHSAIIITDVQKKACFRLDDRIPGHIIVNIWNGPLNFCGNAIYRSPISNLICFPLKINSHTIKLLDPLLQTPEFVNHSGINMKTSMEIVVNNERVKFTFYTIQLLTSIFPFFRYKARILKTKPQHVFVHYINFNKRFDQWITIGNTRKCAL